MRTSQRLAWTAALGAWLALAAAGAAARDLAEVRESGVLRHLGIAYANFVTGAGDGLDVELIRGFADHLGVRYEFVATDWSRAFGDLTGVHAKRHGSQAVRYGTSPVRGDLIANGMTVLGWRSQVVDFSDPTFPSSVWLIAQATSPLTPIRPSGLLESDIHATKALLDGTSVLAKTDTSLGPGLYRLGATRADIRLAPAERKLNEMVPALLVDDAETALLDVPDALIALERWPGKIKVIGPISESQRMAVAFAPGDDDLRTAFNNYLTGIRADGSYRRLVEKYYPAVFGFFPDFFAIDGGS